MTVASLCKGWMTSDHRRVLNVPLGGDGSFAAAAGSSSGFLATLRT